MGGDVVEEARQGGVAAVLAVGAGGDGERGSGWGCGVWCIREQEWVAVWKTQSMGRSLMEWRRVLCSSRSFIGRLCPLHPPSRHSPVTIRTSTPLLRSQPPPSGMSDQTTPCGSCQAVPHERPKCPLASRPAATAARSVGCEVRAADAAAATDRWSATPKPAEEVAVAAAALAAALAAVHWRKVVVAEAAVVWGEGRE